MTMRIGVMKNALKTALTHPSHENME
jgi:hypothetical protein